MLLSHLGNLITWRTRLTDNFELVLFALMTQAFTSKKKFDSNHYYIYGFTLPGISISANSAITF